MNSNAGGSILRLAQVLVITGLSKSTIYAMVTAGTFPRQVRLGKRSVGWQAGQVFDWVALRPQA
ncbi:MAG: AlpA family phage regulatory protein [Xanthomonadales bacterium]|nr:AlpA family phage regulatory protein [Xanthomonadales bacterium]